MSAHIARLKAEGRKLPDGYDERPALQPGLVVFWEAFWELSTERQLGFGAEGRIPGSAIEVFAGRLGIDDPDERAFFRRIMRGMDGEYLARRAWTPSKTEGTVAMSDHSGIRSLLRLRAKPEQPKPKPASRPPS